MIAKSPVIPDAYVIPHKCPDGTIVLTIYPDRENVPAKYSGRAMTYQEWRNKKKAVNHATN